MLLMSLGSAILVAVCVELITIAASRNSTNTVSIDEANTTVINESVFFINPTNVSSTIGLNVTFWCQHSSFTRDLQWQTLSGSEVVMTVDINNPVQPPLYFTVALDGLSRLTVTIRTDLAGYCFRCYAPQANVTSECGCLLFQVPDESSDNATILAAVLPFAVFALALPAVGMVVTFVAACVIKRINSIAIRVAPADPGPMVENPSYKQRRPQLPESNL